MYISLPRGGDYVSFAYCRFAQSQLSYQSAYKYNIYIYIYIINAETHRNPPNPTETNLYQLIPTETNPSPTRPLCDVVSLHRDSRKMRTIPNSSRRLSIISQPKNLKTLKP